MIRVKIRLSDTNSVASGEFVSLAVAIGLQFVDVDVWL